MSAMEAENDRLRAINAELMKTLEWIADHSNDPAVVREANAAIEKNASS